MRNAWKLFLMCFALSGCASYRPAPLSVRVTSTPSGAEAQLHCPNLPVRQGSTPVTFRVPRYATPCALVLSKEGFKDKQVRLTLDELEKNGAGRVPAEPRPGPIQFTENATPFSVLGALIVRSLDNLRASASERLSTAIMPDAQISVILEPAATP
jgi:hypothetical protein